MKVTKHDGIEPDFPLYHFEGDPIPDRMFVFGKGHPNPARMMVDAEFAKALFMRLIVV